MITEQQGDFEILSDGRTVWLNGPPHGHCLARFGPRVWEAGDQVGPHGGRRTDWSKWTAVVEASFGVRVADKHRPTGVGP